MERRVFEAEEDALRETARRYIERALVPNAEKWEAAQFNLPEEYGASEESLRELFALIQKYPFWTDDGGLSDDSVKFMIDIATESGVLTQPMNPADIVDRETLSRAVELANMPTG
jgi:hypothetical protein